MRAAHCDKPGVVTLRETAIPIPTEPDEVLLRVLRCGICGSDLHWYCGQIPPPGVCPGHEISAVVAATGPGVTSVREGDRVVAEATRACGTCRNCRSGDTHLCKQLRILGVTAAGGFADYLVTDSRHLHPVPTSIDDATAQLTEPLAVGVHALRLANVRSGDRVLILGAGSVGLLAIAAAREADASEIAILARRPHQIEAAASLGATRTLRESVEGEKPEHQDFDIVLDTVTSNASLRTAVATVRAGGCVALLGITMDQLSLDALRLVTQEIHLVGSMCYGRTAHGSDFGRALAILEHEGALLRDRLITHEVPLSALDEGFQTAAQKETGSIKVSVAVAEETSPA